MSTAGSLRNSSPWGVSGCSREIAGFCVRSWLRKAQVYPRSVIANAGEIPVGGVKLFQYPKPGEQCILIRTAEDAYVAYSQKCTHLSCAVFYSREHDRLECPVTRVTFP